MQNHHTHGSKSDTPERKRYLQKKPLSEALSLLLDAVQPPRRVERILVENGLQRTTVEPIFALLSAPHYHGAAMDGIAVRAAVPLGRVSSRRDAKRAVKPNKGASPIVSISIRMAPAACCPIC